MKDTIGFCMGEYDHTTCLDCPTHNACVSMIANGIVDPAPSTEDWIVEDKGEIKEVPASLKDKFEFLYGPIDDLEFNWGDPAADGETAYIENNSYALETDPAADGEMAATEDIIDALETQVKTAYALVEKKDRRVRDLQQRLNYFSEYYDPALTKDLADEEATVRALATQLDNHQDELDAKDKMIEEMSEEVVQLRAFLEKSESVIQDQNENICKLIKRMGGCK